MATLSLYWPERSSWIINESNKTEKKSWLMILMKPRPRRCDSPAIQLLSYAVTMRIASNLQPVARGDSGGTDEPPPPPPPPPTHTRWRLCECCHFLCSHTHECKAGVHTGAHNVHRQVLQDHRWGQYGNSCVSLQHFSSTKIQLYNECTMKRLHKEVKWTTGTRLLLIQA